MQIERSTEFNHHASSITHIDQLMILTVLICYSRELTRSKLGYLSADLRSFSLLISQDKPKHRRPKTREHLRFPDHPHLHTMSSY